ncbi:MAG: NAD(+)/NADH kinase [Actinomycetota bacterium]|nr:NAD(+)/NADH kinase [Actinomycetota bacterium]
MPVPTTPRRVALVVNPSRPGAEVLAEQARHWWEAQGYSVVVDRVGGAVVSALTESLAFAISFGGDGTMLRAVQATAGRGVPVLGVNLGKLGYLTEVEPETATAAFARLAAGDYAIESRMALEIHVETGLEDHQRPFTAINEVAIERVTPGHTVRLAVQIDGSPFLTYAADGLLVATPTGSTAYNLSARGPVLSPRLRALVLTAISPHGLFDRSVVLSSDQRVSVRVLADHEVALVLDGSAVARLRRDDEIHIGAAQSEVAFVSLGQRDFHAVLRAKFSVADR